MKKNESNNDNQQLVYKTKKVLNEMGFDIKTGQVYELYSKILNHPSYNVAKTKNEDFDKAFNNVNFEPPKNAQDMSRFENFCEDVGLGLEGLQKHYNYLEALERGDFKDKFFYGVSKEKDGFALLNPLTDPGAIYVGKMGSGKSIGMKMTVLTHMLANSDNTIYVLYDELKGMADYKEFFKLNNVVSAIENRDYIIPIIENIYKEMMERNKVFKECNGILEYEKKTKTKLPRIVLVFEEFMSILSYSHIMKYADKSDTVGTIANKFRDILRIGRTYGITVLGATQHAKKEDLPDSVKVGLCMRNCFAVSNMIDHVSFMGEESKLALSIPRGKAGRCYGNNDFGEIQYPYFSDKEIKDLLNKYVSNKFQQALTFNTENLKGFYGNEISQENKSGLNLFQKALKTIGIQRTSLKDQDKILKKTPNFRGIISEEDFKNNFIGPKFKDSFFFGQKEDNNLRVSNQKGNNIGCFGGLGSGKTIALSSIVKIWMANNSEKTNLFIIDTSKSEAIDYKNLFKYEQTKLITKQDHINALIDNLYKEMIERRKEFKNNTIKEYETINNTSVNRILVVFEQASNIFKTLKYNESFKDDNNSTEYKLCKLCLSGRDYGFHFLFSSTEVGTNDFPKDILKTIITPLLFKGFNSEQYVYLLDDKKNEVSLNKSLNIGKSGQAYDENLDSYVFFHMIDFNLGEYIKKPSSKNFFLKI